MSHQEEHDVLREMAQPRPPARRGSTISSIASASSGSVVSDSSGTQVSNGFDRTPRRGWSVSSASTWSSSVLSDSTGTEASDGFDHYRGDEISNPGSLHTSIPPGGVPVGRIGAEAYYFGIDPAPRTSSVRAAGSLTNNLKLACDFRYNGCREWFGKDDSDAMLEHTLEVHLQGKPPTSSTCAFCETEFPSFPAMTAAEKDDLEHKEDFRDRIEHMLECIELNPTKPQTVDWRVVRHACKVGTISMDTYSRQSTMHASIDDHEDIHPAGFVSPKAKKMEMRANEVRHDNDKEERAHRRSLNARSSGHGSGSRRSEKQPANPRRH